jgi:hypothetical protein
MFSQGGGGGLDAEDAVGPKLPSAATRELIPHNLGRVEVRSDLEQDHRHRLGGSPRCAVREHDGRPVLGGRLARVDNGLPRAPVADTHFPEIAGADRPEHRHASFEELPKRAHVAVGPVGAAPFDAELPAERVQRVGSEGEGPAREDQRVERMLEFHGVARPRALGLEEADVPGSGVRDEDGAVERGQNRSGDRRERRGACHLGRPDAMDMGRSADPDAGIDDRADGSHAVDSDDPLDADFHHAILADVETGHFEIDECKGRLVDR